MKKAICFTAVFMISTLCLKAPAQEAPDGRAIYEKMREELKKIPSYSTNFHEYSARGPNFEINAERDVFQRCIQNPRQICNTFHKTKYSFPEQSTDGYQECYSASDDINRLALPGAYKALGVVKIFPEDPKAYYINGENLKFQSMWDYIDEWDRMMKGGSLTAEKAQLDGKEYYLLTIKRGTEPDPDYHIVLAKIYVDEQSYLPVRFEYYHDDQPGKAAYIAAFSDFNPHAGLENKGKLDYQGLVLNFSLVNPSTTPALEKLTAAEPKELPEPAPEPQKIIDAFSAALSPINDYQVTMNTRFRFMRLRLIKTDKYSYIKQDKAFGLETTALEANYILLGGSAGSRMFYAPSQKNMIKVLPGGVYRFMGEQDFIADDPRLFTSMGDNVHDLNFFGILDKINQRMNTAKVRTVMVDTGTITGPMIELKTEVVGPREPRIMRVIFDPQTNLPARVEFRGYSDAKAFCVVEFADLKINPGVTLAGISF